MFIKYTFVNVTITVRDFTYSLYLDLEIMLISVILMD